MRSPGKLLRQASAGGSPACLQRMHRLNACALLILLIGLAAGNLHAAPGLENDLQSELDRLIAEHPEIPGVAVALDSDLLAVHWTGAAGVSDLASRTPLRADQPVRLASTTKTYTAAGMMRLVEQGKVDLDGSISEYLPPNQIEMLESDHYQPEKITVRHLLTHTSGIADYALADPYVEVVLANPQRQWTRNDQLQFAVDKLDKIGEPGDRFHYSDTGYILLGQIIESQTGLALGPALRELLHYDRLGLKATWQEEIEAAPAATAPRAHQYAFGKDTSGWSPTIDLYGGGGLVATMPDLARFYAGLFEGKVFASEATLATMLTSYIPKYGGPIEVENGVYCFGIFSYEVSGMTVFDHGGFWGTLGGYVPALDLAFGIAITHQESYSELKKLLERLTAIIRKQEAAGTVPPDEG